MSERYPGGYITKNAPQPTGGELGTAPGVWTLEEAAEYQKAGTWPSQPIPQYIENLFSTYLYTGNGIGQTIVNNINLGLGFPFVVYNTSTNSSALNGSFTAQTGDILVSYVLSTGGSSPDFTLNGVSKTAVTTKVDGIGYWNGVFIEALSAGSNTFSTGAVGLGYTTTIVIRGSTNVSVATNLTEFNTASITTSSFSTTGFGLLLISDRDPEAVPVTSGSSYIVADYTQTYFKSRFFGISGNGTTVAAQTVSGLVATYVGCYCNIKVEGLTNIVPTVAGKGGLVWTKSRNSTTSSNVLIDTSRGTDTQGYLRLFSNLTNGTAGSNNGLNTFTSSGYTIGSSVDFNAFNQNFVSWTFREQPKFFDVVTFTGTGSSQQINHNLASTPGCIFVKNLSTSQAWYVYHRSLTTPTNEYLVLNNTNAVASISGLWGTVNNTQFGFIGNNGENYVAYLFAHNAGGFGLNGTDNIISCGSYNGTGGALSVTLGYEPQWLMVKRIDAAADWCIVDNVRSFVVGGNDLRLAPNLTDAEVVTGTGFLFPTATGFGSSGSSSIANLSGATYIYMAIRRGPMRTPTTGTTVFTPVAYSGNSSNNRNLTGFNFPVDLAIVGRRTNAANHRIVDRLRGSTTDVLLQLITNTSNAEDTPVDRMLQLDLMNGIKIGADSDVNVAGSNYVMWGWGRASGFMDIVCYAGTGVAGAITNHNLGVSPELIITRVRNFTGEDWVVHYRNDTTITAGYLNLTNEFSGSAQAPSTDLSNFTSTTYTRNTGNRRVNATYNYVAYLFASCPGVSKVGSVNITGSVINVDCGFTNGARFILLKRIVGGSSPWLVWDTARGISAGDDPYLALNNTSAENFDGAANFITPYSAGFTINAGAIDGYWGAGNYLYLAIS